MAVLDTVRPISAAPAFAGFTQFVTSSVAAFAEWNDARKTEKALKQLDARQLEDIGLSYADIQNITRR